MMGRWEVTPWKIHGFCCVLIAVFSIWHGVNVVAISFYFEGKLKTQMFMIIMIIIAELREL